MRIITGYILLIISCILFLAIPSFNINDSLLFVSNPQAINSNIADSIGLLLATPLIFLYGRYASLLLAFGILTTSINLLIDKKSFKALLKLFFFNIATISLCVLIYYLSNSNNILDYGMSGVGLNKILSEIMPDLAIMIIFASLFVFSLLASCKLFRKLVFYFFYLLFSIFSYPAKQINESKKIKKTIEETEDVFNKAEKSSNTIKFDLNEDEYEEIVKKKDNIPEFLKGPSFETIVNDDLEHIKESDNKSQQNLKEMHEPFWLRSKKGAMQVINETRYIISGDGTILKTIPDWLVNEDEKKNIIQEVKDKIDESETELKEKEEASHEVENKFIEITEEKINEDSYSSNNTMDKVENTTDMNNSFITINEDNTKHKEYEKEEVIKTEEDKNIVDNDELHSKDIINKDNETIEKDLKENERRLDFEIDEVEEISGEADYIEEKEKKKTEIEESEDKDTLFDKAVLEGFIFPETRFLDKNFDTLPFETINNEIRQTIAIIENTFESFKIPLKISSYSRGPAITRYEIIPPTGLKIKNVLALSDDLALNLGSKNIRIVAPIGNKSIIGIEVPNKNRENVLIRDIIESSVYKETKAKLPLILGKDIAGNIVIEDLCEMPHLLVAGTTGSGKSVYINSLIFGLLYKKSVKDLRMIFIDPKMVELELYNGIPHLLCPVITKPEEAIAILEWAGNEMERRYKILSEFQVRNITDYNKEAKKYEKSKNNPYENMPYIVIIIDEFANLMLRLPKETEKIISKIAAMARAVGIHLVVATQRPSVDVVTGIIKANFPSRIAFRVSSSTDSRTILDKVGAEKLLGKGDMLFMTPNFTDVLRIQSPYVSNNDVEYVCNELKQNPPPDFMIDINELLTNNEEQSDNNKLFDNETDYRNDPIFIESLKVATENGEISASYLQRKFRIGYNRAARIIETMDRLGILAPSKGAGKPREVLIKKEDIDNYL